jgi:hypothetical protein
VERAAAHSARSSGGLGAAPGRGAVKILALCGLELASMRRYHTVIGMERFRFSLNHAIAPVNRSFAIRAQNR